MHLRAALPWRWQAPETASSPWALCLCLAATENELFRAFRVDSLSTCSPWSPEAHAAGTFSFSCCGVGVHAIYTPGAQNPWVHHPEPLALNQEGDSRRRRHDEECCCLGPKPWPSTRLHRCHAMMYKSAVAQEKTKSNYCQAPGCSCTLDLQQASAGLSLICNLRNIIHNRCQTTYNLYIYIYIQYTFYNM